MPMVDCENYLLLIEKQNSGRILKSGLLVQFPSQKLQGEYDFELDSEYRNLSHGGGIPCARQHPYEAQSSKKKPASSGVRALGLKAFPLAVTIFAAEEKTCSFMIYTRISLYR
jgi:hypothetical protein